MDFLKKTTLILLLCFSACAAREGFYHRVQHGETLYRISRAYRVTMDEVARANNLRDKGHLRKGQYLFIPRNQVGGAAVVRKGKKGRRRLARRTAPKVKVKSLKGRFVWPIKGKINRRFGKYKGKNNLGIDILASSGTSVQSTDHGKVVYAGNGIEGSGQTIIIRHSDEIFTVYSHLGKIKVKKDSVVKRGQSIGFVGFSNYDHLDQRAPFLHFEIRERTIPVNPELLLP